MNGFTSVTANVSRLLEEFEFDLPSVSDNVRRDENEDKADNSQEVVDLTTLSDSDNENEDEKDFSNGLLPQLKQLANERGLQARTSTERRDIAYEAGSRGVEFEIMKGPWMELYVVLESLIIDEIAKVQASKDSKLLWTDTRHEHKYIDNSDAYQKPSPRCFCGPDTVNNGDKVLVLNAQYTTANEGKTRPLNQSLELNGDGTYHNPSMAVFQVVVNDLAASRGLVAKPLHEFAFVKDVLLGVAMPYGFNMNAFLTHLKSKVPVLWNALLCVQNLLDDTILTVLSNCGVEKGDVSHIFMGATQRDAFKEGSASNFHTELAGKIATKATPFASAVGIPHTCCWISGTYTRLKDESLRRADEGFSLMAQLATGDTSLVCEYAQNRADGINIDGIRELHSAQSAVQWSELTKKLVDRGLDPEDVKLAGIPHATAEELDKIYNYTDDEVATVKRLAQDARKRGGQQSQAVGKAAAKVAAGGTGTSPWALKLGGQGHSTMEDFHKIGNLTPAELQDVEANARENCRKGGRQSQALAKAAAEGAAGGTGTSAWALKFGGQGHSTMEDFHKIGNLTPAELQDVEANARENCRKGGRAYAGSKENVDAAQKLLAGDTSGPQAPCLTDKIKALETCEYHNLDVLPPNLGGIRLALAPQCIQVLDGKNWDTYVDDECQVAIRGLWAALREKEGYKGVLSSESLRMVEASLKKSMVARHQSARELALIFLHYSVQDCQRVLADGALHCLIEHGVEDTRAFLISMARSWLPANSVEGNAFLSQKLIDIREKVVVPQRLGPPSFESLQRLLADGGDFSSYRRATFCSTLPHWEFLSRLGQATRDGYKLELSSLSVFTMEQAEEKLSIAMVDKDMIAVQVAAISIHLHLLESTADEKAWLEMKHQVKQAVVTCAANCIRQCDRKVANFILFRMERDMNFAGGGLLREDWLVIRNDLRSVKKARKGKKRKLKESN